MKNALKTTLTALSLSLAVIISGCTTVESNKPHTEAYKGEYYDKEVSGHGNNENPDLAYNNEDFDYDYPGKVVSQADGELINAAAEETYKYAMTLKTNNPMGMVEALYLAAKQGSGSAHYELARELTSGINIEKNPVAAQEHLMDAVALNHAEALRVLGQMNIRGDSMAVNIPAGMAMLEQAAQTSTRAARELGYLYQGKAYPQIKDTEQAVHYLTKSYAEGDVESAYMLGEIMLEIGNPIEALTPLSYAASKGHPRAAQLVAKIKE